MIDQIPDPARLVLLRYLQPGDLINLGLASFSWFQFYQRSETIHLLWQQSASIVKCLRYHLIKNILASSPSIRIFMIIFHLKLDPNFSYFNETPLTLAIRLNKSWVVRFLLAHSANPDYGTPHHHPVHEAIQYNDLYVLKLLIQAGASVNGIHSGLSPLWRVVQNLRAKPEDSNHLIVNYLLSMGAQPVVQHMGRTLLHQAILTRNYRLIEDLLPFLKEELEVPDHYGETPLIYAITIQEPSIVSLLLKMGADRQRGNPLAVAQKYQQPKIIRLLS